MKSKGIALIVLLTLAAAAAILLVMSVLYDRPLADTTSVNAQRSMPGSGANPVPASPSYRSSPSTILQAPNKAGRRAEGWVPWAPEAMRLKRESDDAVRVAALEQEWSSAGADRRKELLIEFAAHLDEAVVRRFLLNLDMVEDAIRSDLQCALLVSLTRFDAPGAAALAEELVKTRQAEVFAQIAGLWVRADPRAAADWTMNLANGQVREETLRRLMNQDPSTAARLISSLAGGQVKTDMLDRLVAQWSGRNFEAALTWAKGLPEEGDRMRSLMQLSYQWERQDPKGALEFAQGLPEGRDDLIVSLAGRWVQRDPTAAAAWATELPEGRRQQKIIASMTAAWASRDLGGAGEFVMGLPDGAARREATISVVSAWSAKDPTAAAAWVEQLPPGSLRDYAIQNVMFHWTRSNAAKAAAWRQHLRN